MKVPQLVELSIEVTNKCPLACIHCSSGSSPEAMPNELGMYEHLDLISQAKKMGATVLSLSGGEPLVCDHTLVLALGATHLGYERILLYTTGHHLQGDYVWEHHLIDDFLEVPNLTWIFSLHSRDCALNDKIMGRENAATHIKTSIKYLTERGADVEVHMVPMAINRDIVGMRDLCEIMGVKKLSLLRFVPQTRGYDNQDELLMDKEQFAYMQWAMHATSEYPHTVPLRMGCPIDFRHTVGLVPAKQSPCHAGDDLILVRPEGDAHPCAAWKSLPCDVNVREHTLEYIFYESKVFKAIREFKAGGYYEVESCQNCKYLRTCMAGCPAQRLQAYGKTLGVLYTAPGDPLCHLVDGSET